MVPVEVGDERGPVGTCRRAAACRPRSAGRCRGRARSGRSPGPRARRRRCCRRSDGSSSHGHGVDPRTPVEGDVQQRYPLSVPPLLTGTLPGHASTRSSCDAMSHELLARDAARCAHAVTVPAMEITEGRITANGIDVRLPRGRGRARSRCACTASPTPPGAWRHLLPDAGRRRVPRRRAVHAGLRAHRRSRRRPLPDAARSAVDAIALHEALGGDGERCSSATTGARIAAYGAGGHAARSVAPGRHRRGAASRRAGAGVLHLRPAAALLVHVLLPAPAGRPGRAMNDLGVHRPAVGGLVARLRRAPRTCPREGLPARPGEPRRRARLLPRHARHGRRGPARAVQSRGRSPPRSRRSTCTAAPTVA